MGVVLFHSTFRAFCWLASYMTVTWTNRTMFRFQRYKSSSSSLVRNCVHLNFISVVKVKTMLSHCGVLLPMSLKLVLALAALKGDTCFERDRDFWMMFFICLVLQLAEKHMGVNSQQQRQILPWSSTIILVGVEVLWALSDDNYTCTAEWPPCRWCRIELSRSFPQNTGEVVAPSSSASLPFHPRWVLSSCLKFEMLTLYLDNKYILAVIFLLGLINSVCSRSIVNSQ